MEEEQEVSRMPKRPPHRSGGGGGKRMRRWYLLLFLCVSLIRNGNGEYIHAEVEFFDDLGIEASRMLAYSFVPY